MCSFNKSVFFCVSAEAEKQIGEFRNVMLEFVKMERDLKQFQEAVEFVKSQVLCRVWFKNDGKSVS